MKEFIINDIDFSEFVGIPYVASRHPGSVSVDEFLKNPRVGSNCQLLALGVLKKAGFYIGKIRIDQRERLGSRELWLDTFYTRKVCSIEKARYNTLRLGAADYMRLLFSECKPFSLVFFWPPGCEDGDFRKLHVGVCVSKVNGCSEHRVLHNPREGPSVVWSISEFIEHGYFPYGIKHPRIRILG